MLKDTSIRQMLKRLQHHPAGLPPPLMYPWAMCVLCMRVSTHTCMWTCILLQRRVDLCCLFNIAENATALSHLGKQVIAISIIYSDIQWSRPQTILTSRLTEINAAAHKWAYPQPPLPIPLYRLHLFPFSSLLLICFFLLSIILLFCSFSFPTSSFCLNFLFLLKQEQISLCQLWLQPDP